MAGFLLTPDLLALVARRFKALAEPARLTILAALRNGEMTVSQLIKETELGQANLSKHLQLLFSLNFVDRRKEGLYVHYRLADEDVFRLCDIMCGRLAREADVRSELLSASADG